MRIVYHCYGGTHSSLVAASIHLGLLPSDGMPSPGDLLSLPYFDKQGSSDAGKVIQLGVDEARNPVCFMGRRRHPELTGVLRAFAESLGIPSSDWAFVNAMHAVNLKMKLGGFLSRRLNLKGIGRRVVVEGTLRAYPLLRNLARQTRVRYADRGPDAGRETCAARNGCDGASSGCVFYYSRAGFSAARAAALKALTGRLGSPRLLEEPAPGFAEALGVDEEGRRIYALALSSSPLGIRALRSWLSSEGCEKGVFVPVGGSLVVSRST